MTSDSANNRNSQPSADGLIQWDIDRYLLSDPSFDRDAFEKRMLDNLSLAERVAASVADLHAISSAVRISASTTILAPQTSLKQHRNTARWAMLVTTAVVLLAVSAWQFRRTSNDDQLSLIANHWVGLESLSTAESLELIANEDPPNDGQPNDGQLNENQSDVELEEQSDWLVEAAREFYLANGAAG